MSARGVMWWDGSFEEISLPALRNVQFGTERPLTFWRPVHGSGEPFDAKSGTGRDA